MKKALHFLLIAAVVITIRFVSIIIVSAIVVAIDKLGLPLLRIVEWIVYGLPVIACLYVASKIAERKDWYRELKAYCIVSICFNVVFLIINLVYKNPALPNFYMIVLFGITGIDEANKNI